MEQPSSNNSKKRVFPGSSSSCMDQEVVEISNPNSKQKGVLVQEVISIDDDLSDVMIIDEKEGSGWKGKEIMHVSDGQHSNITKDYLSAPTSLANNAVVSTDGDLSSSFHPVSHGSYVDKSTSDFCYDDDEYVDIFPEDLVQLNGYSVLQSHFDKMDIPPGVEAPIPWWSDPEKHKKRQAKPASLNGLTYSNLQPLQPSGSKFSVASHPHGVESSNGMGSTYTKVQPWDWQIPSSNIPSDAASHPHGVKTFRGMPHGPFVKGSGTAVHGTKKQVNTSLTLSSFHEQNDEVNLQSESKPSSSWWKGPIQFEVESPEIDGMDLQSELEPSAALWTELTQFEDTFQEEDVAVDGNSPSPPLQCSSEGNNMNEDENLKKLQLFKRFDMVDDYSGHHYAGRNSSLKQPPKTWAKNIQNEWRILEKDLPDTIFVRVYESRMDLLRAAIIGAEGTPYHNGLFFFDIFFPAQYPNEPPQVHYRSFGLRLNPNLYNSGKVCLSLLNTWDGNKNEKWIPGISTMLQVLVSIQALILNASPYFNEPGYARLRGSKHGQKLSEDYNEDTYIKSLQTMLYTIRKPLKYFEDLVVGHFCKHAHDILFTCRAYMDSAQEVEFKEHLIWCANSLVRAFTQIGAKDCEKFRIPEQRGKKPQGDVLRHMHFHQALGIPNSPDFDFSNMVYVPPVAWTPVTFQPPIAPFSSVMHPPGMMPPETMVAPNPLQLYPVTMIPQEAMFPPTPLQTQPAMPPQPFPMPQSATSEGNSYLVHPF